MRVTSDILSKENAKNQRVQQHRCKPSRAGAPPPHRLAHTESPSVRLATTPTPSALPAQSTSPRRSAAPSAYLNEEDIGGDLALAHLDNERARDRDVLVPNRPLESNRQHRRSTSGLLLDLGVVWLKFLGVVAHVEHRDSSVDHLDKSATHDASTGAASPAGLRRRRRRLLVV